jgi:hypothetical protein
MVRPAQPGIAQLPQQSIIGPKHEVMSGVNYFFALTTTISPDQ